MWARSFNVGVPIDASSPGVDIAPTRFAPLDTFEASYGANLIGVTVRRIRGRIWVPVPPAATLQFRVGFKITDQANPPDSAEQLYRPDDIGGAHDDWFGWYVLSAGPVAANIPHEMSYVDVDVRSARKVDELGERMQMHVSAFSGIAEAAGTLAFDLSVLVALP